MAIDGQTTWQADWDAVPIDSDGTHYASNIANFIDAHSTGKMVLETPPTGFNSPSPPAFTYGKAACQSALAGITFGAANGAQKIADAWQAGVTAGTLVVPALSALTNPSTPASKFAAPPTVVVDPASLTSAHAGLLSSLQNAPLADGTYAQSLVNPSLTPTQFPVALRTAFLALKYTLTGLNSVAPTPATITATLAVQ